MQDLEDEEENLPDAPLKRMLVLNKPEWGYIFRKSVHCSVVPDVCAEAKCHISQFVIVGTGRPIS